MYFYLETKEVTNQSNSNEQDGTVPQMVLAYLQNVVFCPCENETQCDYENVSIFENSMKKIFEFFCCVSI